MYGKIDKVDEYEWMPEKACWVDATGKPAPQEIAKQLHEKAEALFQADVMDRLDAAREIFMRMTETERKAALDWLKQAYHL